MAGRTPPKLGQRPFTFDFTPLRKRRRYDDITQVELARAAGVHVATIHRLEHNLLTNPSLPIVVSIARLLGVPMYELFTVVEAPPEA